MQIAVREAKDRMMSVNKYVYQHVGHCPVCESDVEFRSPHPWYRDFLVCSSCGAIPRERALALVLSRHHPNWRNLFVHESSPSDRGISRKLKQECGGYIATQFFPEKSPGCVVDNFRNENLEAQTFADAQFDLVVTLDVMEHVNHLDLVVKEVARTLRLGGSYIFSAPTYKGTVQSERRALYLPDGTIKNFAPAEYHGNPVSDAGSLVTFHYGYDLPELINTWSGMDVDVFRFHNHHYGIIGEFTEIYVCKKNK